MRAPLTGARLPASRRHPMTIERFFTREFSVKRHLGDGATGPVVSEPVSLRGRIKHENRIVIDDKGNEVVSTTKISMSIDTPRIPTGSVASIDNGPWRTVIAESRHIGGFASSPDYYSIDLN
ncbi:head-tail connector protein [Gordonia phage Yeezy]|uniref:Head-to-tail stopper n=1 Tax=Gordonia phage Yeezy TaxID=1821565 RepID=A0A142K9H3_9CAUD|nr:head-tail connector protein [Gordonia phage Yeezy]AMS02756.1 head-to-tail stopper [Gordonia phage Yeezy]